MLYKDDNLHQYLTNQLPEWTSSTWKIDFSKKRLLSKRIDGKEAVAQAAQVAFCVDYLEYPIFSDRFGLEIKNYIGKGRDFVKCNIERLVKECLAPDLRINKVLNFEIEDLEEAIHCVFTIECKDGLVESELEVPLE